MIYYVMEPPDENPLPQAPKDEKMGAVETSDIDRLGRIDYDARSGLISDRLKLLMEKFSLKSDFVPVVYWSKEKQERAVFWRFCPPDYHNFKAIFRNDGIVSHISHLGNDAPIVFTVRSPSGERSVVTRLAVVESALLRSIFGLKFTRVSE
ncbi:MAG: hypothetical protein FWG42_09285 [Clostridiales bacterium]|nr:hypothetical protein [Clostridiales bacterium]